MISVRYLYFKNKNNFIKKTEFLTNKNSVDVFTEHKFFFKYEKHYSSKSNKDKK
jgi:hypothetical protein